MALTIEVHTADQDGRPVVVVRLDDHVTVLPASDAIDFGNALIEAGIAHEHREEE